MTARRACSTPAVATVLAIAPSSSGKLRSDAVRLGNAALWWDRFRGAKGVVPARGAIAWWGARRPARPYGHVAYVQNVGGGTITVREMNHAGRWNVANTRLIDLSSEEAPDGYLYKGAGPQAPPPAPPSPTGPLALTRQVGNLDAATFGEVSPPIAGQPIAAGSVVEIECQRLRPAIPDTGKRVWWFRVHSLPWDGEYYAQATAFLDDPQQRPIPPCIPVPADHLPGRKEIAGHFGAPTFANLVQQLQGASIEPHAVAYVDCKIRSQGPLVNAGGFWYQLIGGAWAPASAFLNGDRPGGPYTRVVDRSVRDC